MGIVRFLVPVLTCHEDKGWAKRNICIYNIVYVVYRTAVDGLSGLMFGGFTSRTPLSLYIVGVDVPEPFMPVPDSNSSTLWGLGGSGLRGYRMCGLTSHASGAKRTMSIESLH